jgi:hypothetical protein
MSVAKPQKAKAPKNCHICGSSKHVVKHCVLRIRYMSLMDTYMIKMKKWVDTQLENRENYSHLSPVQISYEEKNFLKFGVWFMQNKEEGMRNTTGLYIYADECKKTKKKKGFIDNFYDCYNNIGSKYFEWKKKDTIDINVIVEKEISCPICLEELEGKPTCTTLCNHTFCSSCFHRHAGRSWGRGNDGYNCPLCRRINS